MQSTHFCFHLFDRLLVPRQQERTTASARYPVSLDWTQPEITVSFVKEKYWHPLPLSILISISQSKLSSLGYTRIISSMTIVLNLYVPDINDAFAVIVLFFFTNETILGSITSWLYLSSSLVINIYTSSTCFCETLSLTLSF